MDRFLCMLLLGALLFFAGGRMEKAAQPAFFSLLFPQLVPGQEEITTPAEAQPGEAVFL